MTPAQCRAARRLVDLSQAVLSSVTLVPATVIADYEAGAMTLMPADLDALQDALERAGVEFIEDGVKLRKGGK
jgi:hypothetical protein